MVAQSAGVTDWVLVFIWIFKNVMHNLGVHLFGFFGM